MRFFDERHIYYGNLEYQQQVIGSCRCEVLSNELDPESWKGSISVFNGSHVGLHRAISSPDDLLFKATNQQEELIIKPMYVSYTVSSRNDEILKFRIKQLIRSNKYGPEPISKVYISYFIPHTELYKRSGLVTKDYRKGLLMGWNGWRRGYGDPVSSEWVDEVYVVPSSHGKIAFVPAMLFQETPLEDKEAIVSMEQAIVECSFEGENFTIEYCKESVDNLIEDYLYILSFIEGDFLEWYLCRGNGRTNEDKHVADLETFKPIRIGKKTKRNEYHFSAHRQALQRTHIELTRSFTSKSNQEKESIRRVINRFIVASRVDAIDTKLIYWHSCLDVLSKRAGGEGRSFSHRIVDSCKKMNVDWRDIYPEITEASLEEKAEFPINRIRNTMLHQGEYPNDYTEAFQEIPKTRALSERLIMAMLGIPYAGTGLGTLDFQR